MNENSSEKKLVKSASGLRMVPLSNHFASPFALTEPDWIVDKQVKECVSCKSVFDFFKRKHHCRRCGSCFCDRCCHYLIPLKRMYFVDPVRHCYECAVISKAEADFFETSLKTLQQEVHFSVQSTVEELQEIFVCCIAADHRSIMFHPRKSKSFANSTRIPDLLLSNLIQAQFQTTCRKDKPGVEIPIGVSLAYKDKEDHSVVHHLTMTPVVSPPAVPWLSAFQQAAKLIFDSTKKRESG